MAHTIINNNPGQPIGSRANVDKPVGKSWKSKNLKTDVMLVQSLLRIFFYEMASRKPAAMGFSPPPGFNSPEQLKVDGVYGPITQKHIDRFLDQLARSDPSSGRLNDHAIDPIRLMFGSKSKRAFVTALADLNDLCFEGPGVRSTLLETRGAFDSDLVPPLLLNDLTRKFEIQS